MAGGDEDDDETLIADVAPSDESTDEGRTLVAALPTDDGDATLVAAPLARLAPRGPLPPPAAGMPPPPRAPPPAAASRFPAAPPAAGSRFPPPQPAAGSRSPPQPAAGTPRTGPPPPPPRGPAARPSSRPPVQADDALDRRALPFSIEAPAAPIPSGFVPVTRTQEMPNISHDIAQRKVPSSIPAPPPPAPPPPAAMPSAPPPARVPSAPPPPRASTPAPVPSTAAPALAPPPLVARPPQESVIVTQPEGTPPFVIRYLLVCGVLTALGLIALIVLEL